MQVKDIMTKRLFTTGPKATVGEAAKRMLDENVSCLPVVDNGRVVGILSHSDFEIHAVCLPYRHGIYSEEMLGSPATTGTVEKVAQEAAGRLVEDVMRKPVYTVEEEAPISKVAELMLRHRVHRLPVMRGDQLVGIVSRHDLLKLVATSANMRQSA